MSGHSKWANIKNKKAKTDAQKGKIFTKIGRELAVAVKAGGPDPSVNSKLADVIAKAKANNMPNDTISRSIKKAAGEGDGANYEELVYEGYGPAGVAVIVELLTDNRNRTAGEIRHIFDKAGGSMGATGCVSWMFDKKGIIVVAKSDSVDEEELMMSALDVGAEDFVPQDESYEIYTKPEDFSYVRQALEEEGYEFLEAQTDMVPQNTVAVSGDDVLKKIYWMLDQFDDHDDVQNVYHNAELPEEEEEE
ncbi:MAG: YebC/PmpR family DNA-binding transcriptional regulator [Clostridia bacterium]|nr:YebC/PmpR family DNA-binding transcriptional regulator [Clostridia bacterium]